MNLFLDTPKSILKKPETSGESEKDERSKQSEEKYCEQDSLIDQGGNPEFDFSLNSGLFISIGFAMVAFAIYFVRK